MRLVAYTNLIFMKKISLFLMTGFVLAFSGCDKEDDAPDVTETNIPAAEAKTTLTDMSGTMKGDVVSITQSEGVEAVTDLLDLFSSGFFEEEGRMLSKEEGKFLIREKARIARSFMIPQSARTMEDDGSFNFAEAKGVYEWNAETESFDFAEGGSAVVVKFPTEGSASNNAVLRLTNYEEVLIEFEGERYFNPAVIAADLSVDEVELITLDLEINWSSKGEPETAFIDLFVKPFSFTLNFDDSGSATAELEAAIDKGTESIVAVAVKVDYTSAHKEDVKLVDGFVSYRAIKIDGDIDVAALDASEDGDPNDYVHLSLLSGDRKLGDIVFVKEEIEVGVEDWVPYVKFNDDSTQKLEDILKPVLDEAEAFFNDLEDSESGG